MNGGWPPNAGGNADAGTDFGTGGASSGGTGGTGGAAGGTAAPRIRKDFPETLYVNPEVITGPDGKATIDVNMADSITQWRVSTLAHSAGGKLGGGQSGIKVFQDFFADINFPATLTRGDEVEFPIAVYNYLSTPQTVKLELAAGAWYTPLGSTTQSVDVGPGEVVGVRFPVRVEQVGLQTLTVTATGSAASDALARQVLVVPDGKEFPTALSGSLGAGSVQQDVSFPANAVPGSDELYLEVYPAFLSQVVTGMDSMLQVPNGCFEQTTSTTWPNVLVTRYMTQTGQITPAIQLKAESLISAGYQRLLTFEHKGGGFSWFGEQDPAPYLSVTAFGLMEFADMAKVQPVDPAMVQRTVNWMVAQQQTDGSWKGDQSEFFTFQTSVLRNTAFVVWALAENNYTGPEMQNGLSFVKSKLGTDEDPYTLGLVANAFAKAAPADPALSTRARRPRPEEARRRRQGVLGLRGNADQLLRRRQRRRGHGHGAGRRQPCCRPAATRATWTARSRTSPRRRTRRATSARRRRRSGRCARCCWQPRRAPRAPSAASRSTWTARRSRRSRSPQTSPM